MRACHVGVHQHGDGEAAMGRATDLLGQHDRGTRVEARATHRFGHTQREEAELAHVAQHLARHEACLLPFRPVRLHLLVDEAAELGTDEVVFLGEDRMCHGGDATLAPCHATNDCRIARSSRIGAPIPSASPTRMPRSRLLLVRLAGLGDQRGLHGGPTLSVVQVAPTIGECSRRPRRQSRHGEAASQAPLGRRSRNAPTFSMPKFSSSQLVPDTSPNSALMASWTSGCRPAPR